ncbi:MAG: 3-dehydroquinate synthase [Elusimicrobia bacterium]|nr:3-dehydroquinate synthase [Elusimicrobiota bacterium]
MSLDNFTVRSRLTDYNVLFAEPADYLPRLAGEPNCVFAVDENVWRLHKGSVLKPLAGASLIILPISEELKSLKSVQMLYDRIVEFAPKKNMRLVSIGGGITQDITGFVASTLYRGIKWTFIPTTLLAQADSCIGGKTSLNYKNYKNLAGTFYPPSEIYISAGFLSTLKDSDYLSGLGEIAKLCIIGGEAEAKEFAGAVERMLKRESAPLLCFLRKALGIKKGYIEDDEFDSGRRNMLNFGHCFGHAIESATDFAVPHGLAVVYGIILANMVSRRRGLLSKDLEMFMRERILSPIIPPGMLSAGIDGAAVVQGMKKDKKRTGAKLALVMAMDGFRMTRVNDLDETEALAAVAELWPV